MKERISSTVLLSLLIVLLATLTCSVALTAPPSYVSIYAETPFDEAYSSGYINLGADTRIGSGVKSTTIGVGNSIIGDHGSDWASGEQAHWGNNNSKQDNIWIDYFNGAVMNGVTYDVRIYFWAGGNRQRWITYTDHLWFSQNQEGTGYDHMEMHFYEAGHAGDPAYERTFRGVMCLKDIDGNTERREQYRFYSGHVKSWAKSYTTVSFVNGGYFYGTKYTEDLPAGYDGAQEVWCEVEGSASSPIHLEYGTTGGDYGSNLNYWGAHINYVLQSDGKYPLPSGATMSSVHGSAVYGTYRYASAPSIYGWQFDGWYNDSGLTSPTGATAVITGDKTVYGTYHRVIFGVSTTVTNGTITPTNNNISIGTNYTVSYAPNNGYLLSTVVVDGTSININSYPDSYTFSNIQADHTVAVTYAAPSASKSWALYAQS